MSVINQKIVEYVRYYSSQGYSIDKIRSFLISNNISQKEVDEAIASLAQNQNKTLDQSPQINALEMQLRSYMQSQLNAGYNIELIKTTLIQRGYEPAIVKKVAADLGNVNINIRHEVHVSKGTIIGIVASLFIMAIVVFGILNISMFKPDDSLLDISVSTSSYSYLAGETVDYQVHVSNMGTLKRFDITIRCLIVDDAGEIVQRKEDTLAIETTASVARSIQLPANIKPGKYALKVIADYGDKQAKSSVSIEVVQSAMDKKSSMPNDNTDGGENEQTSMPESNNKSTKPPIIMPSPSSSTGTTKSFGEIIAEVTRTASTDTSAAAATCSKLTLEQKDICYSVVADSSSQKSYCDKIIGIGYRDNCYLSFLVNFADTSVCDQIQDTSNKEFCRQLQLMQLMDKYYQEGDSEKIAELSKQLNPDIYGNTPQIETYEHVYSEPVTILDISNSRGLTQTDDTEPLNETPLLEGAQNESIEP